MTTPGYPNVYFPFRFLCFINFGRCSPPCLMRIKFLNLSLSFIPVFFFLPWKLSYNIKLLFTWGFFFPAYKEYVTFLCFQTNDIFLSIKLNDFYCLWGLQPH